MVSTSDASLIRRISSMMPSRSTIAAGVRTPERLFAAHLAQPALHARIEFRADAERTEQSRGVGEQRRHFGVDRPDRMARIEPEGRGRPVRAMAKPVPDFALVILRPAEKDRLAPIAERYQRQRSTGLAESRQVPEVAVEPVGVLGVAVAHALRRGEQNRNAAPLRRHRVEDADTAAAKGVVRHRWWQACRLIEDAILGSDARPIVRRSASRRVNSAGVPTLYQRPRKCSPVTRPARAAA